MDWKKYYDDRVISAQEAASKVKSGDRVVMSHAAAEPLPLIEAMAADAANYRNVETVHMIGMTKGLLCQPEMAGHIRHNSIFVGAPERKAVAEARADFTPIYFSNIPGLFLDDYLPVDVAMVQVSPPDKHGYMSLGVTVDYAMAAVKKGKLVIAQVNKNMPRTHGDSFVHCTEIDYFVEEDRPLTNLPSAKPTEVEEAIGANCASLVEDGCTLQLGIGALPNALLEFLHTKKDLGIHSEVINDGVVDLVEAGIINNSKKTLHPGRIVATFLMGTRKLYDFVDDNPIMYMAPANYTNDPYVIAKNYKMTSINSCVQVDLMGQVASESVGLNQISGAGGQVDFVRGANMCPGGVSIIALPSTAKGGEISKIVPFLDQGAAVTTSRCEVHYIVTEYGIACMRNVTLRERCRRLIAIAHPKFRPMLQEEYERRFREKF